MNFTRILRKIGIISAKAAPDLIRTFNPVLGEMISRIVTGVASAEKAYGPGTGVTKKQVVLNDLRMSMPMILRVAEQASGRDLADDKLFKRGALKMIDAVVDLMNAFRVLR